jgi:hypothetical protein
MVMGMGDNVANTMKTDAEGRKLDNLPIMQGINNYSEMNLVVEFSGSSAGGLWIVFARPKFGLNVSVGVTAVMAADMYPYLQSGQLIGMLTGLMGAAEYEKLVDIFAAYRDPAIDYRVTTDQEGDKILPGRPFGREILDDEASLKLSKVSTQTLAKFTPEQFVAFSAKYPEQLALLNNLRSDQDGMAVIDVTKITPELRDQMGEFLYRELNQLTRNTIYKFKVARIGMNAQSVAHIVIILFIVIGNVGYFIQKARGAQD